MRIAVMQPYLFPYIGYFQLLNAVDKFIIFDDVNYINKGWINRNRILVNKQAYLFTVPLNSASQNKLINEITIENGDKWRNKLTRTLELSYSKAPYFAEIFPLLKDILYNAETNLSAFVGHSITAIAAFLNIKTVIEPSSTSYGNRNLNGEDRILDICLREQAGEYVNPIGGEQLYDRKKFEEKGIKLFFIKTGEIAYDQNTETFVPWLSIIDVLMFCGKEQTQKLLLKMELI